MEFAEPLRPARLLRRYKRFLADVTTAEGEELTVHCPNTGAMLGCAEPGSRIWLSHSSNPKRKYAYTWELVETAAGVLVGVHPGRANALVEEALAAGAIPELAGYSAPRREVRVPDAPMRADLLLQMAQGACYVEVKSVTAAVADGVALFPDAVSSRGSRHLEVLGEVVRRGGRAALVYAVQREDVCEVRPADGIDPAYGRALRAARAAGVELYALGARLSPQGIRLVRPLPVVCPAGLAA